MPSITRVGFVSLFHNNVAQAVERLVPLVARPWQWLVGSCRQPTSIPWQSWGGFAANGLVGCSSCSRVMHVDS